MKVYVANIKESQKMVYLSGIRYIKKGNKYDIVPVDVSVKKEIYNQAVKDKKFTFPIIFECEFIKGKGAKIKMYEKV